MNDTAATDLPAIAAPRRSSWLESFRALLETELASYPGRPLLVLRIVLACTFVTFCIMVFRISGGVLGAYYPLLISRDNLHSTRRSALWIACACTLGTVEVAIGAMLFVGSPFLHLLWVWGSLFAIFYFISTVRVYEAALALGVFLTSAITIWDQQLSSDLRLRQTLFTLLVILVGCAVSVVIEYLFSRTHPPDAVIEGIQQRLTLTERVLQQYISDESDWSRLIHELRRNSARGTATLRAFIAQSGYSFEEQQRLSTAVSLAGRLIDLSSSLTETERSLTATDRELCTVVCQNLSLLGDNLSHRKIPEWIDIDSKYQTSAPILIEIERTVDLLAESLSQSMWDSTGKEQRRPQHRPRRRIFISDAFSSDTHLKFAIRGGLSAIVCYMFYMSVGWIGLSASVATCILTALPVTGAARHKQLMRFAGVVLGACALGFAAQIIILPQIDSILSYTLLFASVTFIGAWIATSSPRIAYCGVQIVLAYELVNLNRFSLNPTLIAARDAVLGIVLGIGAMWLIFDHLWATTSTESLRPLLSVTIREIADLSIEPVTFAPAYREASLEKKTSAIMNNFGKLRSLIDVSIFEAFPKAPTDELLLQCARDYLPQLRATLLIKAGLIHHQTITECPCESEIAVQVQQRCTELLRTIAFHVETDSPPLLIPLTLDQQLKERLHSDTERVRKGQLECDQIELRLCSSLFNVVHHLAAGREPATRH
ncbi:FUSC family protein [Edaphobacter dinghuensis]|uniref:Multidrug resistance protein MdtO n=1 Tax=Edaphobacter dinghuensis TaxID=1560005 RepID=A0A917M387_9BACT|nr:FUSC family protein [Edaphobacter dinghuensis]GGG72235.1 hypothetical protein GCM10011585_13190 [Edaphobacter dinghuensis]